jgi:threonylcarbamoyladenosine tRNA methylthiotransferase MtaB
MKTFHIETFGCKTNQYDSQAIREQFLRAGFEEAVGEHGVDLYVVNTCTVTHEADRKCRAMIRRLHRENPGARIAVTGCGVELNFREFAETEGVSFVILNQDKARLVEKILSDWSSDPRLREEIYPCGSEEPTVRKKGETEIVYSELSISYFADRTRAFLKIQDGCDHSCTYCKVVLARGSSRSRLLENVIAEARRLTEAGYKEIVLTGIQLGAYGDDFGSTVSLVDVLEKLIEIEGLDRIRLSSIDPSDAQDRLISLLSDNEKICNHLHLPLQSGDDEILKRMKRAYRTKDYLRVVEKLYSEVPDFALTTDVMVGFPGESERHFSSTLELLKRIHPLKIHIFPFSSREGTRAAEFPDRVEERMIRKRVGELSALERELSDRFRRRFLGRDFEVLTEAKSVDQGDAFFEGRTRNYLKVLFPGRAEDVGKQIRVRLEHLVAESVLGSVLTNCK